MSNETKRWWDGDKKQALESRIKRIQKMRDPKTNADEILLGSKFFLWFLILFTGILGGISYFKFFSTSFPLWAAVAMAGILTVVIEYGKNYCSTGAVRTPFFLGWNYIFSAPAETIMWVGLVLVSASTFSMSIINSTRGGHQLAIMLGQEKDGNTFTPNTAGVDSLIAYNQKNIAEASTVKWRGVTTRTSQEAIKQYSTTISSLQQQRETLIAQQRKDWERGEEIKDNNRTFSANWVFAAGGWVELLQILFILLRVSCEKILDSRIAHPTEEKNGAPIGFKRGAYQTAAAEHSGAPNTEPEIRRPIGFFTDRDQAKTTSSPVPPPTVPDQIAVAQCSTDISTEQSAQNSTTRNSTAPTVPARATGVLADIKYWQKLSRMALERSETQQRLSKRKDNWDRYCAYRTMLEALGVRVERGEGYSLIFTHPPEYNTSDEAMRIVEKQYDILHKLKYRTEYGTA